MNSHELVSFFLEKGYLLSPDLISQFRSSLTPSNFLLKLRQCHQQPLVLHQDIYLLSHHEELHTIHWEDFARARVTFENGGDPLSYNTFLETYNFHLSEEQRLILQEVQSENNVHISSVPQSLSPVSPVRVLFSYEKKERKIEVQDFVRLFKKRYEALRDILLLHSPMHNCISIQRLYGKSEREAATFVGIVSHKDVTKNGNIVLTCEDPTGSIKVLFTKQKEDLFHEADDIVLDEVLGITGVMGNNIVFANGVYFPDIPLTHPLKKGPDEVYAVFISDIHFGIKQFCDAEFRRFASWLHGEYGNEKQRLLGRKVKYVFVVGDIVEGVGIYPHQEDIYEQYVYAAEMFSLFPSDIYLILCGGNHDAMRMAEPQPPFPHDIAGPLYSLPHVTIVSNPSLVRIHISEDFPGFDVLLYHGYSLIYYSTMVNSLRQAGGQDAVDTIMQFLLRRRHLAPSHGSTLYVPDPERDPLVLSSVPDFFVTGHIHRAKAGSYRNVTLLNCSCWVTQTEDQEKRGIIPDVAKVPVVNLQTREVSFMRFYDG